MDEYTNAEVKDIAKGQRVIIWMAVILLLTINSYAYLIAGFITSCYIYQLAKVMKLSKPGGWALGVFVPLLNLFLLLSINGKATAAIKSKGVSVGLFGAKRAELDELEIPFEDQLKTATLDQLEDMKAQTDQEKDPERYALVVAAIEKRKPEGNTSGPDSRQHDTSDEL